jgi:amino acid transporter
MSTLAITLMIAIPVVFLWLISIGPVKSFFNEYTDWKRPIWLFKILSYTPVINFAFFTILIIIGMFAVIFEAVGNPFEDLNNKNKV